MRVVGADAVDGHGEYILRVLDGPASWLVRRRWRDVKALSQALHIYSPLFETNALPTLPRSMRGSASPRLLAQRKAQLERHVNTLLRSLPCSVRERRGPGALLAFLSPVAAAAAAAAEKLGGGGRESSGVKWSQVESRRGVASQAEAGPLKWALNELTEEHGDGRSERSGSYRGE